MKKQKIYYLKERKFYGYDKEDDENIEDIMDIGYFASADKVEVAKKICIDNGIQPELIFVDEFEVELNHNQRYVYITSHEYSIIKDGQYIDYTYIFPPLCNRKKCLDLIEKLKTEDKYKFSESRCYEYFPPDGFFINKLDIDTMWYPIFKKL